MATKNTWQKTEYQKRTLGEVVDFIDGDRGSNYPSQGDFFPSGYCLFLNTKNVPYRKFSFDEKMFVTEEKDALLRKGKLQRGDYVLTTRGAVGNFAHYNKSVPFENVRINSGMVILRKKSDLLDENFLHCYLSSDSFTEQVKSRVSGSAQPQLPIRDMLSMEIILPNIKTQTLIASVLSAYDDLIENNEKRIKRLEEMAQLLYTEWFVKFKFPGHEKVKMVESGTEYGKVPEGWEVKKLSDIAIINNETISKSNEPEIVNYVDIASVSTGKIDAVTTMSFVSAPSRARRILRHGDIIWSTVRPNRKSYALVINPIENLIASTGFAVIRTSFVPFVYLYQVLSSENFVSYLVGRAQGSAYPAVTSDDFFEALVLISDSETLKRFDELCEPIAQEIQKLFNQNNNLSKTRDLLVPQLVTGKREVR